MPPPNPTKKEKEKNKQTRYTSFHPDWQGHEFDFPFLSRCSERKKGGIHLVLRLPKVREPHETANEKKENNTKMLSKKLLPMQTRNKGLQTV